MVRGQHRDQGGALACAGSVRWRASAASPAKSASNSTPPACSRCAPRPPMSRASCARSSRKPRGGAPTSAASSNRCAPSPPSQSAEELGAMEDCARRRPPHPPRPARHGQRHRHRAALARRCSTASRWSASKSSAARGRRRGRCRRWRARRAGKTQGRAPGHHHHRGLQFRRSGESRTSKARWCC